MRRTRRLVRALVGLCAVGSLLVPSVTTAEAASRSLADRSGDVVDLATEKVERRPSVDITDVRGTYGNDGLITVRITFDDLRPGAQSTQAFIVIDDEYYVGFVRTSLAHRRGSLAVSSDSGGIRCPRATHRVRYDRDIIRVSVPRSCLAPITSDKAAATTRVQVGGASSRGRGGRYYDAGGADGTRGDLGVGVSAPIGRG